MSVKNLLAMQEAGFISLHELLTLMTKIDGASYEQAATLLYRLLWSDRSGMPNWWINNKLRGVGQANDQDVKDAFDCLAEAAQSGEPLVMGPDEIPS